MGNKVNMAQYILSQTHGVHFSPAYVELGILYNCILTICHLQTDTDTLWLLSDMLRIVKLPNHLTLIVGFSAARYQSLFETHFLD